MESFQKYTPTYRSASLVAGLLLTVTGMPAPIFSLRLLQLLKVSWEKTNVLMEQRPVNL